MSDNDREKFLVKALKRAETDFLALVNDDRLKVDPAFALDRVRTALASYREMGGAA